MARASTKEEIEKIIKINQLEEEIEKEEKLLKSQILEYYKGNVSPESLLWEILPDYFVFKLHELLINFVHLKTNIAGDRIDFVFYVTGYLEFRVIVNICQIVDQILKANSDKWDPTSYTSEIIASVSNCLPLVKYKLTTINGSRTNFAKGKVNISKYLKNVNI